MIKKRPLAILSICIWGYAMLFSASTLSALTLSQKQQQQLSSLTVPFIENKGQINADDVRYYAPTFGGTLFVRHNGEWVYHLPQHHSDNQTQAWAFSESLVTSEPLNPTAQQRAKTQVNYFKGQAQHWQQNLATYSRVEMNEIYPGISMQLVAKANNIEKIFIVQPDADAKQIRLQVNGINQLSTNTEQQLILHTELGEIAFTAPIAYQIIDGTKQSVDVAYVVEASQYSFKLGHYDRSQTLIIDPLLASTFIGGNNTNAFSDFEQIRGMVVSGDAVYVAGFTDSSNFPAQLGLSTVYNGGFYDGFIAKFSADLSTLLVATFLGGPSGDDIWDLTMSQEGYLYVVGRAGAGFPLTPGSFRYNPMASGGTFVAKLSNDLNNLIAASLPAANTLPSAITVGNNSVYISGRINTPSLPVTADAFDTTCGSDGRCNPSGFGSGQFFGYAERLDSNLDNLLAATYLPRSTSAPDIEVASNSNVYIISSANTSHSNVGSFDANLTTRVANVSKNFNTQFTAIAVGDNYIATVGVTRDTALPVSANAFDRSCGTDGACNPIGSSNFKQGDGFVAKYSLDLQTLQALTYLGGSSTESPEDVVIDTAGNILVTGQVRSTNFPTSSNAHDRTHNGNIDGFISQLSADLSSLVYSSFIGGSGNDSPSVIASSTNGLTYIAGSTASRNFPTTSNAFDRSFNGGDVDVFISQFDTTGNTSSGDGSNNNGGGDGGNTGTGGETNTAPIANAGADQTVASRITVLLNGSASTDNDGDIVAYRWKQIAGKSVKLRNRKESFASFRAPRVKRGRSRQLVFELKVTDDQGASHFDRIKIVVRR